MNIGDKLETKVISLAYGGEGIIKHEGIAGFINGALPGELIKCKISKINKNYFRAKLLEIIDPSPFRVAPPCPYFSKCGGCCYQHLAYEKQIEFKVTQIKELLQRIGKIPNIEISTVIPSPKTFNYRNQITLKLKSGELGFMGIDNKTFIHINKCFIAKEEINAKIKEIEKDFAKINGDIASPCVQGLAILIKCDTAGNIDYAFLESISDKAEYKLLTEKISGKTYYFSLSAFFQTNPHILNDMLNQLKNALNINPDTILFDLYCGTGLFSICLSDSVKNVYGIEINKSAVKLADKTAETNKIKNCRFFLGKAEDIMPIKYNQNENNILIVDPPRQGLSKEILNFLKGIRPYKLVYISCEPAKMARDLNFLCGNGYKIEDIIIADMFPQTKYMETLVICKPCARPL